MQQRRSRGQEKEQGVQVDHAFLQLGGGKAEHIALDHDQCRHQHQAQGKPARSPADRAGDPVNPANGPFVQGPDRGGQGHEATGQATDQGDEQERAEPKPDPADPQTGRLRQSRKLGLGPSRQCAAGDPVQQGQDQAEPDQNQ